MNSHTLPLRKKIIFLLFFSLFFASILFLCFSNNENRRFEKIANELFENEMRANTLNMHYTLAHPGDFGIKEYEPRLSLYSPESISASQISLTETIKLLEDLQPEKLSEENVVLRTFFLRSLKNAYALNQYPYYREPLSATSGAHSQLPILFAEYTFRNRQDVEDYLALLDQVDEYFASLLRFAQDKTAAGFPYPGPFLKETIQQCYDLMTEEAIDAGTHFLQTTFESRLRGLTQNKSTENNKPGKTETPKNTHKNTSLSQDEISVYIRRHNELLKTVLLPAYRTLGDGLSALEDSTVAPKGLAGFPQGQAYYEHLLISEVGTYRPIKEIKELLVHRFGLEYETLTRTLKENPTLATTDFSPIDFPLHDPDDILVDLQRRMGDDFPALPDGKTDIHIKIVTPEMEDYCAPAFFMTPPLDDTSANTIYINQKKTPDGLELYTTLAHEGFPGHLYQNVYHNRVSTEKGELPARHILWYGGYLEGWAIYVEMMSYDYAAELLLEQAVSNAQTQLATPSQEVVYENYATKIQLEKHNRSLQLCMYSLLDIMIHYENASFAEIYQWLESMGVRNAATAKKVYNYILQEPCNYLKYYLGYLEILELQAKAKEVWGEGYSDYRFHQFYLDCGPSDFTSLQERLTSSSPQG